MQNGYSICYNRWALDKEIKNELNLLLIISSLCAREGYCYASNKYLAELFNITEQSISNKLQKLESKNYIEIEYEKRGCEIISRKIRLKNIYIDDIKKIIPTIKKNFKDNNISINNTSNNNIYIKHGTYKRVKLTEKEYTRLIDEFGKDFIDKQIELLDEYIESNNNKNKYTNFNLVLRKSIRNNWFKNNNNKKEGIIPEWFNKEIKEEKLTEEQERMLRYVNGED